MPYTSNFAGLNPEQLQALMTSAGITTTSTTTISTGYSLGGYFTTANSVITPLKQQVKEVTPKRRVSCQEHYNDICSLLGLIRALKIN